MSKYHHTIIALTFCEAYNADIEKTFTIIDRKDDLTERQLKNRIRKEYGIDTKELRIARTEVSVYA